MPTKHYDIGGSTATRTLNCPGWINASKGIPKRPAGQAAIDGSMHHAVQELCQEYNNLPAQHIGFVYEEDGVERAFIEDDLDLANIALTKTNDLLDELEIDELIIEPFVELIPEVAGGSIDLLGLSEDRKTAMILDYKFGGYKVAAKDNASLMFYATSAKTDKVTKDMFAEVEEIVYAIVQPRVAGVVEKHTGTMQELRTFTTKFMKAIDLVGSKKPPVVSGSWCQWCPSAPYCETKRGAIKQAALLPADSHNSLCVSAGMVTEVEQWLATVKEEMYLQMSRGVVIDGWKVVEKRATRKWADEEAALTAITKSRKVKRADFIKTAMLTAPQATALLKKMKVDIDLTEFIISTSSGTTIAPESDSREAVKVTEVSGHLADLMDK